MENSTIHQNADAAYELLDSQSRFPETCFPFDLLEPAPTVMQDDKASPAIHTPPLFSTLSIPHSFGQPQLDWRQYACSDQQELDWDKYFGVQQTQQLDHLQRQERLQQDHQFIYPHSFYWTVQPIPPISIHHKVQSSALLFSSFFIILLTMKFTYSLSFTYWLLKINLVRQQTHKRSNFLSMQMIPTRNLDGHRKVIRQMSVIRVKKLAAAHSGWYFCSSP